MGASRAALAVTIVVLITGCSGHHGASALLPPNGAHQTSNLTERSDYASSLLRAPEVLRLIDSRVSPTDRRFLQRILPSIPARFANKNALDYQHYAIAIIDVASKRIVYNRAELNGSMRPGELPIPVTAKPGDSQQTGRHADFWAPSTFDEHSGPYRRLYTTPNANPNVTGASDSGQFPGGETADLYLPCGTAVNKSGTINGQQFADQAYAYMGGWSQSYNLTGGNVDAGLMSNAAVQSTSLDDYTMFIRLSGISAWYFQATTTDNQVVNAFKVPCGPGPVHMEFYDAPNFPGYTLVLNVSYFDYSRNATYGATIGAYFSDPTSGGWWASCQSCVLKRMSSIAQDVNHAPADNLTDGSNFRVQWQNATVSCGFAPSNCTPAGEESWQLANTGGCMEFPSWTNGFHDCFGNTGLVNVTNFNYNGEFDFLNIPTTSSPPGNGSGHWSGTTSLAGLNYAVDVAMTNGDASMSVTLQNTTPTAMQLEVPDSCGPFRWYATGTAPSGQLYWQQPVAGSRCLQSLAWITIPANSSVKFPASWTGANLSYIEFAVVGPYVAFEGYGATQSSDASLYSTTSAGAIHSYVATPTPAPTPTPERTPPPCLRQPCPQ